MKYYIIKPEVPAGLGRKSIIERATGQSMKIIELHLEFQGWLGDDLMETHPVFYVTEKLKAALQKSKISGIEDFCQAIVTRSDSFVELYPNKN